MHHLIQSCIMKDSPTVVLSLTQETMARNCGIFSSCKLSLVSALLLSKSISWSNTCVFTTVGWSEPFGWIYKNEKYLEIFVKVSVGTILLHIQIAVFNHLKITNDCDVGITSGARNSFWKSLNLPDSTLVTYCSSTWGEAFKWFISNLICITCPLFMMSESTSFALGPWFE